jgi:cytochrome P450
LRWNTTAPIFTRLAVEDVELEGTLVPEGSVLEVCIGTANRDPRRYDDPDTYNLHRKQQPHLGFAIGQHRCLGMDVARSEIVVGINALIDAFPNLRLDPDAPAPFLTGGLEQRGMSGLPVLLR